MTDRSSAIHALVSPAATNTEKHPFAIVYGSVMKQWYALYVFP